MTGYVQWAPSQEFKPQDVVLNGGLLWRMDDAGVWRIIDAVGFQPVHGNCTGKGSQRGTTTQGQGACEVVG